MYARPFSRTPSGRAFRGPSVPAMRPGLFAIIVKPEQGEAPPDLAPWRTESARHLGYVQVGREHDPHDLGGHEQGVREVPL